MIFYSANLFRIILNKYFNLILNQYDLIIVCWKCIDERNILYHIQ